MESRQVFPRDSERSERADRVCPFIPAGLTQDFQTGSAVRLPGGRGHPVLRKAAWTPAFVGATAREPERYGSNGKHVSPASRSRSRVIPSPGYGDVSLTEWFGVKEIQDYQVDGTTAEEDRCLPSVAALSGSRGRLHRSTAANPIILDGNPIFTAIANVIRPLPARVDQYHSVQASMGSDFHISPFPDSTNQA